jgi:hypothetical protein
MMAFADSSVQTVHIGISRQQHSYSAHSYSRGCQYIQAWEQGSRFSMPKIKKKNQEQLFNSANILLKTVTTSIQNIAATWAQYESRAEASTPS